MQIPVLIPAFEPQAALLETIRALAALGFSRLVVVNDGSSQTDLFDQLPPEVTLLHHPINRGKGAALKTGLAYIEKTWPGLGAVTADADGQHHPDDILAVARQLQAHPLALTLGARAFDGPVPLRSRLGNRLSALLMRLLAGARLHDTQTGLRAIPAALFPALLQIPANGYEFELDMLLAARQRHVPLRETPIRTIYLDNNSSSHFSPLRDSMRIYFVLFRFALASLATALLDNLLFALVFRSTGSIAAAQALARLAALLFNYAAARRAVFHSQAAHRAVLPRYLALVLANALAGYALIQLFRGRFGLPVIPLKIAVELALFLVNFVLQRDVIFRRRPQSTATDWARYYQSVPATAKLTRAYSARTLVALLRSAGLSPNARLCELGGANSCFFDALQSAFSPSLYQVLDTSQEGLNLLAARAGNVPVLLRQDDVLNLQPDPAADLVFSAGLVEHFDPAGTRRAIQAHLHLAKPEALILITFPTPTVLYRATRALLELLNLWNFPDERPLAFAEVLAALEPQAEILHQRILWPLILTQGLILARKRATAVSLSATASSGEPGGTPSQPPL